MNDREMLHSLVEEVAVLASGPHEAWKKELWARHQALQPAGKIPVCVSYEGIPGQQWDHMFGKNHLQTTSPLARTIEFDLKRRVWMARNVPDDHMVWPFITVAAVAERVRDWGVPLEWSAPDDALGAKQIVAPFAEGIDLARLTEPETIVDEGATARRVEEAEELTSGQLAVIVRYPHMGHSPFETVVRLRGMEQLLTDVIEQPDAVHALMDFVTTATLKHHLMREKQGWINTLVDPSGTYHVGDFMRVNASYPADGLQERPPKPQAPPGSAFGRASRTGLAAGAWPASRKRPCLSDEWAYVSAQ